MRILIPVFSMVSNRAPPKTVYNLIKGISTHNIEITLLTGVEDGVFKYPQNCNVMKSLELSKYGVHNNLSELRKRISENDVIYVPISKEMLFFVNLSNDGKPIIAGPNIQPTKFGNLVPYFHYDTNSMCDIYIAYTKKLKEELIKAGINNDKLKVLPHAIDPEIYAPIKKDEKIWEKFNIDQDVLKLLFVGRLEIKKGIQNLIKAFLKYITNEYKNVILVIVSSKGSLESYVKSITEKYDQIKFFKLLPEKLLPIIYASSDIGIFPSIRERFGMVYLESMSSGLPTIGVNSGGPSEIIKNMYDGVLMKDNSVESIKNAVSYLIENPQLRKKLGKRARKTVETSFSPEIIARRFLKIAEELI